MSLKSLLLSSLLIFMLFAGLEVYSADGDIPPYFSAHISRKLDEIKKESRNGASFIFITDTHVKSNEMHSPQLIKYILDRTGIQTIIWGGDAIMQYGGPIEEQWKIQLCFDSVLNNKNIYKVRGNHDFSILAKEKVPYKLLYSNEEAAGLLFNNAPSSIHRNTNEPDACYYFFDDRPNKVRFVVFDTTDSVPDKVRSWGNIPHIHDSQLQWVADSAISTAPEGYGLVFVSHIPIPKQYNDNDSTLWKLRQLIDGVSSLSSGVIGHVRYNFTNLKNVKVLMCLSGHIHSDSAMFMNGVLNVTTANDGKWKIKNKKESGLLRRRVGTVTEQCFDCFCINPNGKTIHAYRIGYGYDRHFHLEPIILSVGNTKKVKSKLKGTLSWTIPMNKGYDGFKPLSVKSGILKGIKEGSTTVVARDSKGNKEYFNITVQ